MFIILKIKFFVTIYKIVLEAEVILLQSITEAPDASVWNNRVWPAPKVATAVVNVAMADSEYYKISSFPERCLMTLGLQSHSNILDSALYQRSAALHPAESFEFIAQEHI